MSWSVKDDQLIFQCPKCNKNYNKDLTNTGTFEFCDRDINKFILLLKKGVYQYECMDSWERLDETLLPNKEYFL